MYQYGNIFFDLFRGEYYILAKPPGEDTTFAFICINDGVYWDDPMLGLPTEVNVTKHLGDDLERFKFAAQNLSELYMMLHFDSELPLP